ncbi:hypothetical protein HPP92_012142 [Vanilla planifolia]|uniref:PUM-HD domain-containing protein n=1 Tax=Vanilla planifolia TaxID=51239 RepID=A0A835UZ45_VANPL|nr:hypothetical protein HPP92_012142 [Vanilla planifolia]
MFGINQGFRGFALLAHLKLCSRGYCTDHPVQVMEGGDMDEFERLLGEIPNVTSGNNLSAQGSPNGTFQELDLIPEELEKGPSSSSKVSNLCNSSKPAKCQGSMLLYGGSSFPTSLDDQNIRRRGSSHEIPKHANKVSKDSFGYDAADIHFSSSLRNMNGMALPNVQLESQSSGLKFVMPDVYEPKRTTDSLLGDLSGHWKLVPINTMAMPINPGMNNCQLLPSFQGVELPNFVRPGYHVHAQSHPTHITQPNVGWHGLEEKYGQFQQQLLLAKQLQNPEVLRKRMNFGMGPLVRNRVQPCYDFQSARQFERCNQNPYLNVNALYNEFNQLDYTPSKAGYSCRRGENCCSFKGHKQSSAYEPCCSARDIHGHQMLDKMGNQCFPEKILTRSHGVNFVRSLRPDPLKHDESFLFDENSDRNFNVHAHQPYRLPAGSSKVDGQICHGSSPNDLDSGISSNSMQIKYNSVDEVVGRICSMAKDQDGCRFLQTKFTEGCREDIDKIFSEIICEIVELMLDPFGNYLLQKLLDVCNEEQMMLILKVITGQNGELVRISCDKHGTRVVQKVIEALKTPEQISMVVSSLEPGIVFLMKNNNGNHVAQRCLQYLSKYCEFLMEAAISNCFELATDAQGCCVLQKCLTHSEEGDQKQRLMTEILSKSLSLSKDPFGNYLVQFILSMEIPWATAVVVNELKGNFDILSMEKYSSNVVERCLKLVGENYCVNIIQELLCSPLLPQILQDQYGNYVIQTALRESKVHRELHTILVEAIRPHASALRSSPYGKKVLSCASLSSKK